MNNVVVWVADKWSANRPTRGQGFVIWYYVSRYDNSEELHLLIRFYESISPLEHPKLSKKKADVEFRIRAVLSKELLTYQLYEKEENGLKPIRSFTSDIDLIVHLDTVER